MSDLSSPSKLSLFKSFYPHVIAVVLFAVLAGITAPEVFKGKGISAHDTNQHKGMSKAIVDHREEFGEEPLWTESMFSGMPAFQISILYPKNLIIYFDKLLNVGLPHPIGYIFKYMLGFYILLLVLRVPWKFAISGAIAFAFSSYFIIILEAGHNSKANAISYIAPAIAGIILAYRGKLLLGGALAAFFLSLNIAANHVQVTYYMGLVIALLGLTELVKALVNKEFSPFLKGSVISVVALILALLVNNTNLRLTNEYVKYTQRGKSELAIKAKNEEAQKKAFEEQSKQSGGAALTPKKAYATRWSYGIGESFTLLVPNFNGGGSADYNKETKTYKTIKNYLRNQKGLSKKDIEKQAGQQTGSLLYWGKQPGVNGPVYIGASLVFLFVLGLVLVRSYLKWWLLASAILGLFIAYGKNFILFFDFMFDVVPFYDKFRAVTIGMIITEFSVPLLAILFIKELVNGEIEKEKVIKPLSYVAGFFIVVLGLMYVSPTSFGDFIGTSDAQMGEDFAKILKSDRISIFKSDVGRSILFVILIAAGIYALAKEVLKREYIAIAVGVVFFLDAFGVAKRYLKESDFEKQETVIAPFEKFPVNDEILKDNSDYRVFNAEIGANGAINDASAAYFHNTIGGYSSVKLMIYQDLLDYSLGDEMRYIQNVLGQLNGVNPNDPNVVNQITGATNVMNMLNTKYIIYNRYAPPIKNVNALGDAWFVNSLKSFDSADSIMFNLRNEDLEKTALILDKEKASLKDSYNGNGTIELEEKRQNYLKYSIDASDLSYTVFSKVYYKDWTAYIDGEEVPVNRVNYVLRGLEIPKGKHEVEFKFEPKTYIQGESISLIASLLVIAFVVFALFKEYKSSSVEVV